MLRLTKLACLFSANLSLELVLISEQPTHRTARADNEVAAVIPAEGAFFSTRLFWIEYSLFQCFALVPSMEDE